MAGRGADSVLSPWRTTRAQTSAKRTLYIQEKTFSGKILLQVGASALSDLLVRMRVGPERSAYMSCNAEKMRLTEKA